MIKLAVLAVVVAIGIVAVMADGKDPKDHYVSRLDHIDVDVAIKNTRLMNSYVNCALGKAKCVGEAKDIHEQVKNGLIIEILETNCAKCTEEQKNKVRKIFRFLRDNRAEDYKAILEAYDPNGELRKKYKEKYSKLVKDEGFQDLFD